MAGRGIPALLGVPFDRNSSYLPGAAKAPPLIRAAFHCDCSNLGSETGVDLSVPGLWVDGGDLEVREDDSAFGMIEKAVGDLLDGGQRPGPRTARVRL